MTKASEQSPKQEAATAQAVRPEDTEISNEKNEPSWYKAIMRSIRIWSTAESHRNDRRWTAGIAASSLVLTYGLLNTENLLEAAQSNDAVREQHISDAAFRAMGVRLNVRCDIKTSQDRLSERGLAPDVLNLSERSCSNLEALKSNNYDPNQLTATQNATRIVAEAAVRKGEILEAKTYGEIGCVATQYTGVLVHELGLERSSAEVWQVTTVRSYDALPIIGLEDQAIPETCVLGGRFDARVPEAVHPPVGAIR